MSAPVAEKQLGMQPAQVELGTDQSTASATPVTLLSVTVAPKADCIVLIAAPLAVLAGILSLTATAQIVVDGVVKRSTQKSLASAFTDDFSGLVWQGALSAGAHTVALRWATSLATISCNAASAPASQHAALYVSQVG